MSTTSVDRLAGVSSSVALKAPCDYYTTANITLSGLSVQAGGTWVSTLTQDDANPTRILVMHQTNPIDNGLWNPGAGTWTRCKDFDGARDVVRGTVVHVYQLNGDLWFEVSTANPIVIGTTAINFVASTATSILARLASTASAADGAGMVKASHNLNYVAATLGAKFREHVSIKDYPFLAKVDGTTDDTAAAQACIDFCASNGYVAEFPPGICSVTNKLVIKCPILGYSSRYFDVSRIKMDSATPRNILEGYGPELFLKDITGITLESVQTRIHTGIYGGGYQIKLRDFRIKNMDKAVDMDGVYITFEDFFIEDCNKGMYPAYLRGVFHLPSTMWTLCNGAFIGCANGFLLENRFGAGSNEDLISLKFDRVGFEGNTHGCKITQRSWNTRVTGCWFEGNTTTSFDGAAADVIWDGDNRMDPGDPAPIYPAPNDAFLGSIVMGQKEIKTNDLYVRVLRTRLAGGEPSAITYSATRWKADDLYQAGGTSTQAGSYVDQSFLDDSGTARTGVRYQRQPALTGGGARSSAETVLFATGSSLDSDSQPMRDVAVVRYDAFAPVLDNTISCGRSAARWSVVYAGTGAINTSDRDQKQDVQNIPDKWLDAWADVEFVQYRFKDAVKAKGDSARVHFGVIAQQIKEVFEARGIDAHEAGILCFEDGIYGVRYEECLILESALMRRELNRLRKGGEGQLQ